MTLVMIICWWLDIFDPSRFFVLGVEDRGNCLFLARFKVNIDEMHKTHTIGSKFLRGTKKVALAMIICWWVLW